MVGQVCQEVRGSGKDGRGVKTGQFASEVDSNWGTPSWEAGGRHFYDATVCSMAPSAVHMKGGPLIKPKQLVSPSVISGSLFL